MKTQHTCLKGKKTKDLRSSFQLQIEKHTWFQLWAQLFFSQGNRCFAGKKTGTWVCLLPHPWKNRASELLRTCYKSNIPENWEGHRTAFSLSSIYNNRNIISCQCNALKRQWRRPKWVSGWRVFEDKKQLRDFSPMSVISRHPGFWGFFSYHIFFSEISDYRLKFKYYHIYTMQLQLCSRFREEHMSLSALKNHKGGQDTHLRNHRETKVNVL